MEHTVDVRGIESRWRVRFGKKIGSATALDDVDIAFHHHILGVSLTDNLCRATHMVKMSLTVEQDS